MSIIYNTKLHTHLPPYVLGPSPRFEVGDFVRLQAPPSIVDRTPQVFKDTPWGLWRVIQVVWDRDPTGWVQNLYVNEVDKYGPV